MIVYLLPIFYLVLGLVLVVAGGELLVRCASALASLLKISPLVIGLTVVAFGTSAPEMAVSIQSALSGKADLATGNVIGSNIANVLLILGLSALIAPLAVGSQLVRFDVPLMIAASFLMLGLAIDGTVGRLDGCLLFAGILAYTGWLIWQSRREPSQVKAEFAGALPAPPFGAGRVLLQVVFLVAALFLLGFGSNRLIDGATDIARLLGIGELIIGLTIVAVGTSLPELVTSVLASFRGQREIAVGNVVGSNLFNILAVMGASAIIAPEGVGVSAVALRVDLPVMIVVAVACLPIFFTGRCIDRWEGGVFVGYYAAYTVYLVLAATHSPLTRTFTVTLLFVVIPLTLVTLLVTSFRSRKQTDRPGRQTTKRLPPSES